MGDLCFVWDPAKAAANLRKRDVMRNEYDFSKARRNPYARRIKRQVSIRLDQQTIEYFKHLAGETGIAYQTLINLYLRDCAASGRRLAMKWRAPGKRMGA